MNVVTSAAIAAPPKTKCAYIVNIDDLVRRGVYSDQEAELCLKPAKYRIRGKDKVWAYGCAEHIALSRTLDYDSDFIDKIESIETPV